jgi:hypothetical protein
MTSPQDFPAWSLEVEDELDGSFYNWPHGFNEARVAGNKPVMPNASSDVRNRVRVELVLFDPISEVVLVPGAVMALDIGKPLVGAFCFRAHPGEIERHCCFDVIPRVSVATWIPEHHSVRLLPISDCFCGLKNLFAGDDVIDGWNFGHFEPAIADW